MNPLTTFYKNLLESIDCTVDLNTGIISYCANGKEDNPVKVKIGKKEKQLVLPTDELIKNANWMDLVAFHPAGENIFQGQSEVFNLLLYLTGLKLHDTIQKAVASIINLGINKDLHDKINMKQLYLLSKFETINKPVEDLAISVAKRSTGVVGKYPLIGFKLERGGEIDEEVYERVCYFVPHILKQKDSFLEITSGSEKSKRVLYSIYEHVIPNKIRAGSNSKQMPYFISFLKCFREVAGHLNDIKEVLGKYTIMEEIKLNWEEEISNLPKLQKKYLPQPLEGNVGISLKRVTEEPEDNVNFTQGVIEDEPLIKQIDETKTTLGLRKCQIPQALIVNPEPYRPIINHQQLNVQQNGYPPIPQQPKPITAAEAMRMELVNKQYSQTNTTSNLSHAINQPARQNYQQPIQQQQYNYQNQHPNQPQQYNYQNQHPNQQQGYWQQSYQPPTQSPHLQRFGTKQFR